MTNTTHTPGPWVTDGETVRTEAEPGWTIAMLGFMPQRKENARLIAAAPDLLATLQYVLDAHDYDGALTLGSASLSPAIYDRIKRAIAKAKGANDHD